MGQRLTRPFRNFNVGNRVEKAFERQRASPKAAPKHEGSLDAVLQIQKENPDMIKDIEEKNEQLHENLKNLYVDTKPSPIQIKSGANQLSRHGLSPESHDLGVMDLVDGQVMPQGRSSLKEVINFISAHYENPTKNSVTSIAKQHSLDESVVQNILGHFKVMHLHIPKEMYKESKNLDKILAKQLGTAGNGASVRLETGREGGDLKSVLGDGDTNVSKT